MTDMRDHEVVGFILTQLNKEFPTPPVPAERIDDLVSGWRKFPMYEHLTDQEWVALGKQVKSQVKITLDPNETLTAKTFKDWLADRHDEIDWKRWVAYKRMLGNKGFTPNVLATLDESTSEIVNCLGDPAIEGAWKRRGLVIGDVQSGKTATYLGAVNKAADAGYRLIILLAGGTEALRKQTQFRVDEGLIGRDSLKTQAPVGSTVNPVIGVGNMLPNNYLSAQGMTTQAADFRKNSKEATNIAVDPNSPTPLVFVLKKNKTALNNLRDWLKSQRHGENLLDVPMLLVDDESDYASVNTKDGEEPTVINSLIRSVLAQVTRSSYLAFTATPFANVFIDHETEDEVLGDDLFPSDYICTLQAPTNYVGSTAYFGDEDEVRSQLLVALDDADEQVPFRHKSHHVVTALPETLRTAIRAFVVASAIREARGDGSPRAMLVNVSRFKAVQAQVHHLVESEFEHIKIAVELHTTNLGGGSEHSELSSLRHVFESHYADAGVDWPVVKSHLGMAVRRTSVRLINSDRVKSVDSLDDLESDRMIAVGGDVLSRGLTLEGLTVSYFHRSVGASDTLLQMARWFGYRPGYEDLCRVWMPDEVADQFRYVSGIVDDLRGQLRAMKKQGLTPTDFGLAVRMHPEALLITARNKMRAAEAKTWTVDIAGKKNLETSRIDSDPAKIAKNREAVHKLASALGDVRGEKPWEVPGVRWPAVANVDKLHVAQFLERYVAFPDDHLFSDNTLASFVARTQSQRLQRWLVGFVTGRGDPICELAPGLSLRGAVTRSVKLGAPLSVSSSEEPALAFRVSGSSARLAGKTDVWNASGLGGDPLAEPHVYADLPWPVLLIYLLEPRHHGPDERGSDDAAWTRWLKAKSMGVPYLVGVKIGIPGKPGEKGADVKYMLNSVALQAWVGAHVEDSEADSPDELDGVGDD